MRCTVVPATLRSSTKPQVVSVVSFTGVTTQKDFTIVENGGSLPHRVNSGVEKTGCEKAPRAAKLVRRARCAVKKLAGIALRIYLPRVTRAKEVAVVRR